MSSSTGSPFGADGVDVAATRSRPSTMRDVGVRLRCRGQLHRALRQVVSIGVDEHDLSFSLDSLDSRDVGPGRTGNRTSRLLLHDAVREIWTRRVPAAGMPSFSSASIKSRRLNVVGRSDTKTPRGVDGWCAVTPLQGRKEPDEKPQPSSRTCQ